MMKTPPSKKSHEMKARITTITIRDISIPVDADEAWNEFKVLPFAEQVAEVATWFFWQIQLPWIDLPEDTRKRFWNEFSKPEASEARAVAVHGIRFANNSDALQLLNRGIQFQRDLISGRFKNDEGNGGFQTAAFIGMQFAEMASKKDHRLFCQLADIIKAGGIDGGTKGGEDSFNGQVIREFSQFVSTNRTLPTKKKIRDALGLSNEKPDCERLRESLKELGLKGLPSAR